MAVVVVVRNSIENRLVLFLQFTSKRGQREKKKQHKTHSTRTKLLMTTGPLYASSRFCQIGFFKVSRNFFFFPTYKIAKKPFQRNKNFSRFLFFCVCGYACACTQLIGRKKRVVICILWFREWEKNVDQYSPTFLLLLCSVSMHIQGYIFTAFF